MVQLRTMSQSRPPVSSFESYWLAHQARFMAMARTEWEALADGPIQGILQIGLDEGCTLSIPLHIVVNGLSQEAVANKLIALLESSTLTSSHHYEVEEWREFQKTVQARLRQGDYDFADGAIMAVDICIERQA